MHYHNPFQTLSKFEWILWLLSVGLVGGAFFLGRSADILTLIASIIGVTALIFVAKGHVLGQILIVLFSLLYGVISYTFRYYGEMITYLGMTAPIAVFAVIAWLRHPFESGKAEVEVSPLGRKKAIIMLVLAILVTGIFYFILKYFRTANLAMSTVSIATSFMASYLTLYRSDYYALAYGANDIVLIILWVLAAMEDPTYLPMVVCFLVFFANDLYGFISWRRMKLRQMRRKASA